LLIFVLGSSELKKKLYVRSEPNHKKSFERYVMSTDVHEKLT